MVQIKVIIMGAAGRDFHNFNLLYRDNPRYQVIAFTACQIPNISDRIYPASLAGKLYPNGIPIYPEEKLNDLIRKHNIDEVVFAYSDVSHEYVMDKSSLVNAAGANFTLLGTKQTMLESKKPVVAVCAVRTGSGKSQAARKVTRYLLKKGLKVVAVRHPMPYGDLAKQETQRFASYEDLDKNECTIEEREEYEPYVEQGMVVFAGVDYGKILELAEKEADVIIWDGGNNDTPFYKPDLHIVIADPHRSGSESSYYPGETNARMADVLIVNKVNTAKAENVRAVMENLAKLNPEATIIKSDSVITVSNPETVRGKKVLVVEDGPTVTHGNMAYGAGFFAAKKYHAQIIDPRKFAIGSIKKTFAKFPHLKEVLPAMGYGGKQIHELQRTINSSSAQAVIVGTPIDLAKLLKLTKPSARITYDIKEHGTVTIESIMAKFVKKHQL